MRRTDLGIAAICIGCVVLPAGCVNKEEEYDTLINDGLDYIEDNRDSRAEKKFKKAIELLPEKGEAYFELFDMYVAKGKYDDAEDILSEAEDNVKDEDDLEKVEKNQKKLKELKDMVPDLKGLSVEDAKKKLKALKVKDIEIREEYSDNVPEGKVIGTRPAADESIKENGSSVIIYVSLGRDDGKDVNITTPYPTAEAPTPYPTATPTPYPTATPTPYPTATPTPRPTATPTPTPYYPEDRWAGVDLGGMEIIIRDWWSGELGEPKNSYEKAQREYREAMMAKYNFKIKEQAISDWGTAPQDFVDYASSYPDDQNYVFVLRNDAAVISAMAQGLMYDLATLDCLDFTEEKFTQNRTHEMYSYGSHIYCCFAGPAEPRDGMFFNPDVLSAAGIDPNSIYDMQANGTWTWDAFESIMRKCQRDTDGDGKDDIFGLCTNNGTCVTAAVISNGGEYIGKQNGKFVYRLEDPATTEALNWIVDIFNKYNNHDPADAQWDYYMQDFKSGKVAFMMDQEYQSGQNGAFAYDTPFTPGFVMFPKGPRASTYINLWDNNPHAIPANYDAQRAWNIAFAWNLYTNPVPGYEDYNGYVITARDGIVDARAVKETIPMMSQPEHGTVTYHAIVPDVNPGQDFIWSMNPGADVAAEQERIRDTWKTYIEAANNM